MTTDYTCLCYSEVESKKATMDQAFRDELLGLVVSI
jgi:hypothetical protein